MNETVSQLKKSFSVYSKNSIILLLSSLNVLPENHSQKHRIRAALEAAILLEGNSELPDITPTELNRILEAEFVPGSPIWNFEDPQEALFTDLVMFHGGNHIIFPEIFSDSHTGLKLLLDTIFMVENNFPENFCREVYFAVGCLLNLSNTIAERMGYQRYQLSPDRHHEPVFFPEDAPLEKSKQAIRFDYDRLINPQIEYAEMRIIILDSFTCHAQTPLLNDDDIWKSPLHTKPFYWLGTELIVTNVSVITAALVHFIVCKIYEYKLYQAFVQEHRPVIRQRINELFLRIDFKPMTGLPEVSRSHPLNGMELFYRFDSDKLAIITIIPDLFASYNLDVHFSLHNSLLDPAVLQRRRNLLLEIASANFPEHELLFIDLYVPIGREYQLIHDTQPANVIRLNYADLITLFLHDGGADGLLFWRFFLAEKEYEENGEVRVFGFLDKYTFYKQNRDSFYFTDQARYPTVYVEIGTANEFRARAQKKSDAHLVPISEQGLIEVNKRFPHEEIPIYIAVDTQYFPRMVVITGPVYFWVHPHANVGSSKAVKEIAWSLMEAFAYWLWQVSPEIQAALIPLRQRLLSFEILFADQDKWETYNYEESWNEADISQLFKANIIRQEIHIVVPFEFAYLINGRNNNNDRVLVRWIMEGVNLYLKSRQIPQHLDPDQLIEKYAPPGKKTMILGFDTLTNPMLHPHELPDKRTVAEFEIGALLNDLALKAAKGYPVGDLTSVREKNKLCHAVVAYYFGELQNMIALFPFNPLLKYLIGLNESLWRAKHFAGEKITSRLACFEQVASMRDEIINESLELEESTLAARCLIELVIATPPAGQKPINDKDIDRMMALSKEIITWGTLSDELSLGVNEMELGILPSGRVGTGKDFLNESVRPYNMAKRNEAIDETVAEEELRAVAVDHKEETQEQVVNEQKQSAFKAEFGYTWETFLDMLFVLIELGFLSKDGVLVFEEAELVRLVQERHELEETTVLSFFNAFCLSPRERWDAVIEPFTMNDIYPWKYSRGLSLMRRPILAVAEGGKTIYYWGMRQLTLSYQYLETLIESGRFHYQSPEMGSYMGQALNRKGKRFMQRVYQWLDKTYSNDHYIIDREVTIDIRGRLTADRNYGDIDILIIDTSNKKIFSIECKHLSPARITSEFATELKKFESEWIGKHLKRHKWLIAHTADLLQVYKIPVDLEFEVRSIFLTSEKVPYPFIRKNYKSLPFYDFGSWQRDPGLIKQM